ncbi:casein lytic proteinase B4 [Actinidia rufa]|uniref:Casein lytic proteinase B4 n=1 Tax=Actinidia rufa TaxID=165716 RepID=A0A7J0GAL5_9ERIC|nr:casein lytic proteinase B4 [Actinidia rufa]
MEKLSLKNDTDKASKERQIDWYTIITPPLVRTGEACHARAGSPLEGSGSRYGSQRYDTIQRSRVGLSDPNRPIASFMFMGPTSVVARLVGALPGYVGYEEGGKLTEAVHWRPYSVVLFDEMDKAHPDVFNILLQLLDDGRITDSQGKTVSFTNCVVIMTSNIGSQYILETLSSAHDDNKVAVYDMMTKQVIELARQTLQPEFMNRIDEYIIFKPLDSKEICKIVEIQLNRVKDRLKQKNIDVQYTKEVVELLAALDFNPYFGARPVKRVIQQVVENEIAMEILRGDFEEEDTVIVDVVASLSAKDLSPQKKLVIKKVDNSPSMEAMIAID